VPISPALDARPPRRTAAAQNNQAGFRVPAADLGPADKLIFSRLDKLRRSMASASVPDAAPWVAKWATAGRASSARRNVGLVASEPSRGSSRPAIHGTGSDFRTAPGQPVSPRFAAGRRWPSSPTERPPPFGPRPAPARIGGIVDRVSYGTKGPRSGAGPAAGPQRALEIVRPSGARSGRRSPSGRRRNQRGRKAIRITPPSSDRSQRDGSKTSAQGRRIVSGTLPAELFGCFIARQEAWRKRALDWRQSSVGQCV